MLDRPKIENYGHFEIADKICERALRGIPQDRWIRGNHEMNAMIKAYMDLVRVIQAMHEERIEKGQPKSPQSLRR